VVRCLVRRGPVDAGTESDAAATAVAMTSVQAFVLPKAAFDRIVDEEPRYYPHFARIVLERFHIVMRFLAESLRLSPDHRLRLRLADLADTKRAQTASDGPAVLLDLSQSELAGLIGLSRQKLNGRLKRLEEEGWVELAPRRIRVLDPGGLRATAAGSLARER
jgi:CRP/FNR family transcriptional regulator, cyclic AMP receptor protein